jgi:hypothetical protein
MSGQEDLRWNGQAFVGRLDMFEKACDPMWLQTIFEFVDERDIGRPSRVLKCCYN